MQALLLDLNFRKLNSSHLSFQSVASTLLIKFIEWKKMPKASLLAPDRGSMKMKKHSERLLFRACHLCHYVAESSQELDRCPKCHKAFLPLKYFIKVHEHGPESKFKDLFSPCEEIHEEDLIKGINVIW